MTPLSNYPEWQLHLTGNYRVAPPDHPAFSFIQKAMPKVTLAAAIAAARAAGRKTIGIPVMYVRDSKDQLAQQLTVEQRLTVRGETLDLMPVEPSATDPNFTTDIVLVCWPKCAEALEKGDLVTARRLADHPIDEPVTLLHQGVETDAWLRQLHETAFNAFEQLYEVYSMSEELWRLKRWMEEFLPFFLEEDPRVAALMKKLEKQAPFLFKGPTGCTDHYENEAAIAGVDPDFIGMAAHELPVRFAWLIDEVRRHKQQRVAELGSNEGTSLFHLMQHAPEVSWHGFDIQQRAVARGHELAQLAPPELRDRFRLSHFSDLPGFAGQFDAVVVFEVLEHNTPEEGEALLDKAAALLKPKGTLYISTPCGNWSAFDRGVRRVDLAKEHINAYTPMRMQKLLLHWWNARQDKRKLVQLPEEHLADIRIARVLNTNVQECNSWVFAYLNKEPAA